MTEIKVDSSNSDISCRLLKSLLVFFSESYGEERLSAVLRDANLPAYCTAVFLYNQDNWLSTSVAQLLIDSLVNAAPDAEFSRKAGRRTVKKDILGRGYTFLKAFGDPMLCYKRTVDFAQSYNRAGGYSFSKLGRHAVQLNYRSHVKEPNRNFCELRLGGFEAFPTLWGLRPADAQEVECQAQGAEACCYRLRWMERPRMQGPILAMIASALPAIIAGWCWPSLNIFPWGAVASALAGCLATVIIGSLNAINELDSTLDQQNADFAEMVRKLRESNLELESRVSHRTAELREQGAQLEIALEGANNDAQAKSRFVASVSHELRTPLTLLLMPLSDMLTWTVDAAIAANLKVMHKHALLLYRQVEHLLEYAAVEAGSARCNLQEANLAELVETWIADMQPRAASQTLTLRMERVGDVVDSFFDVEKVHSIVTNLIYNALKFTVSGSVTCRVFIEQASVVVEVEDTGRGIPVGSLDHIFDRFYQGEDEDELSEGTGLGLTIAKENAALHGGSLTVRSEVGKGSIFRLALPLQPVITERRRVGRRREDRSKSLNAGELSAVQAQFRRESMLVDTGVLSHEVDEHEEKEGFAHEVKNAPYVLIVEDNTELRQQMVMLLRRHYIVGEAQNGKQGLEKARSRIPDAIVSDMQMPEMDGLQFCFEVRKDSALSRVPFIFVTANGSSEKMVEGLEAGAIDYLVKPFNSRELVARIRAQVAARHLSASLDERTTRLAAIGQIATQVAHDIRSPLQVAVGGAETCKWCIDDIRKCTPSDAVLKICDEMYAYLVGTAESALRANEMMDVVLAFIRTGAECFDKKPNNLGDLVRAIARDIETEMKSANINLAIEVAPSGLELTFDPLQLRRMVDNLLRNARDALSSARNAAATSRKQIWLNVWPEGGAILIRVADNGDGIPDEVRGRLGKPFATAGKAGGTGLGLAVAWNVAMAHDGHIEAEDKPKEGGAAFLVRLPLCAVKAVGNEV